MTSQSIHDPDSLIAVCKQYLSENTSATTARQSLDASQATNLDVASLKQQLCQCANDLTESRRVGATELYILAKLKRKFAAPFRKQKYFRSCMRVYALLREFVSADVRGSVMAYTDQISTIRSKTYVPHMPCLDQLAARLVCNAGVLCRVLAYCSSTAKYSGQQLALTHFVNANLVLITTVARVYTICLDELERLVATFHCIMDWRNQKLADIKRFELDSNMLAVFNTYPSLKCIEEIAFYLRQPRQASAEQQANCNEFLSTLFRMDNVDFIAEVQQKQLENSEKREERALAAVEADFGVVIQRTNPAAPTYDNSKSPLLIRLEAVRTLAELKDFQAFIRTVVRGDDVSYGKRDRTAALNCVKRVKLRWSALVSVKKSGDSNRLQRDLQMIIDELTAILK